MMAVVSLTWEWWRLTKRSIRGMLHPISSLRYSSTPDLTDLGYLQKKIYDKNRINFMSFSLCTVKLSFAHVQSQKQTNRQRKDNRYWFRSLLLNASIPMKVTDLEEYFHVVIICSQLPHTCTIIYVCNGV